MKDNEYEKEIEEKDKENLEEEMMVALEEINRLRKENKELE